MGTGPPAGKNGATIAAQAQADRLSQLIDHFDAMLAYWNQDQVCLLANAAHLDWFGKPKDAVVGMTLGQLLGPLYEAMQSNGDIQVMAVSVRAALYPAQGRSTSELQAWGGRHRFKRACSVRVLTRPPHEVRERAAPISRIAA